MLFYEELDRFGDNMALVCDNGARYTYMELERLVSIFAERVYSPQKKLAFLVTSNCEESLWGYLGFMRAGVVPLLIGKKTSYELFLSLLNCYRPSWIWAEESFYCEQPQYRHGTYVLSKLDSFSYDIHPDLCVLHTTSGSTGSPKCVRQSKDNVEYMSSSTARYLGLTECDSMISTLPMNYAYGTNCLQTHLLVGAKLILTENSILSRAFWETFRREEATNFGGVVFTYEMLQKMRFSMMDLPSLRLLTQAGGKFERDAILRFLPPLHEKNVTLTVFYGQTEGTSFMSIVPPKKAIEKAGTIGVPFEGMSFSLIDNDGNLITRTNTRGELVVDGPAICMGYAEKCTELNLGDEWHGHLVTGDYVTVDEDGYYTVVGRKKRFLKVHGERVSLDEIESLLRDRGYNNACKGTDDHVEIFTTETDLGRVLMEINKLTAINRECLNVYHVSEIPRNEAGKVQYAALDTARS